MANKAEMEAELESLRKQKASREPKAEPDPKAASTRETSTRAQMEDGVQRVLEEHEREGHRRRHLLSTRARIRGRMGVRPKRSSSS